MTTKQGAATRTTSADRALARALMYRLLSQCLVYPTVEGVRALRDDDLPQVAEASPALRTDVGAALAMLAERADGVDADGLSKDYRRCFSHVMSVDCPTYEAAFTARQIFEETRELADLGGFYRAFGLELAEPERPDHIGVELEFMHLLALKESYARVHHTESKARICRDAQRAFVRDHLGRWAGLFSELLSRKAGGGFYEATATLLRAFVSSELAHLRVDPEPVTAKPDVIAADDETEGCPLAAQCGIAELGAPDGRVSVS